MTSTRPRLIFFCSAALLIAAVVRRAPLPPLDPLRAYGFFDLRAYRAAAGAVSQGHALYALRLGRGLGFTYPPVTAMLLVPLQWLPLAADELAVTLLNIALVAALAHVALRLKRGPVATPTTPARTATPWLAAALALWVEPVTSTIGYGQIDLLITALILVDLTYGERSRLGGLGVGAASALKLTPLIFIPYLTLTGHRRMASRATGAFLFSIMIAFAVLPGDARTYWGGAFLDVSRVTGRHRRAGGGPANQSLRGALLRIDPGISHLTVVWLLVSLLIGGVGLLLAARAARRGDTAWGFLLTAITGLLICPISWTHHWTIAVAGVLPIVATGQVSPSARLLRGLLITSALGCAAIWPLIHAHPTGEQLSLSEQPLANLYVLIAMTVIAAVGALELRRALARRRPLEATRAQAQSRRRGQLAAPHPLSSVPGVPGSVPAVPGAIPGGPGVSLRAITPSQPSAPDRQSTR